MAHVQVIGIDPAPAKGLTVWRDDGQTEDVPATEAKEWVIAQIKNPPLLIAWDSPLSFCSRISLSARPVEYILRRFIAGQVDAGKLADRAVSVMPFCGCSHWTISCEVLGMPFGSQPGSLKLVAEVPADTQDLCGAIEVHPAVTLAIWWVEQMSKGARPMPKYKNVPAACKTIAETLGFPKEAGEDDDKLDAYVAWRMAKDFLAGEALWVGLPSYGGFVLPNIAETRWNLATETHQKYEAMLAQAKAE